MKWLKKSKDKYIPIEKVIEKTKKSGVDFGKGDPYNRLRYYTKIGLLPNMRRKKTPNGKTASGHYPSWVVERLIKIERYKASGYKNEEVKRILEKEEVVIPFNKKLRNQGLALAAILILLLASFYQNASIGNNGQNSIPENKTGSWRVPEGQKKVFIFDSRVRNKSKIFVTFTSSYSPAFGYFISKKVEGLGFEITLTTPSLQSAELDYWIIN